MALRIQRNVERVFVPSDVSVTATKAGKTWDELSTGEIAMFSPGGTCVDTTTALTYDTLYLGYKSSNAELIKSDPITVSTIKNYKGKKSAAATEQIDYIGYNGTSGSITVTDSNLYMIRLWFTGDTEKAFMEQLMKYGVYKSDATATQEEITLGLAANLYANMKNEREYRVNVEVVNGGTTSASSGGAWTVVNGSKYVSVVESSGAAADAGKYNSDGSTLAVGDYIRFGHATTKTFPVYRVAAITGEGTAACTVTLDREYVGTSGSVAFGSVGCMASATALAANFGIKLTGVAKPWKLGWKPYNKVMWRTEIMDFGSTTVTESQKPTKGTGTYYQVAEAEWFAQGFEGGDSQYRTRAFAPAYEARADAESAHYYSILTFDFKDEMQSEIGPLVNSPKSIMLCLNVGGTAGSAITATSFTDSSTTGLLEVLDAVVADKKVGTAQLSNV